MQSNIPLVRITPHRPEKAKHLQWGSLHVWRTGAHHVGSIAILDSSTVRYGARMNTGKGLCSLVIRRSNFRLESAS